MGARRQDFGRESRRVTSRAAALRVLSGGAAKGLVEALRSTFAADTGAPIEGAFGAVGAMKERLLAGEPCDVVILTAALIAELTDAGHLVRDSARSLGRVRTGLAVRTGAPPVDVASGASLRTALLAAEAIYLPDPQRATAGIHFAGVLRHLGIDRDVALRLRPYANGAAAMAALAQGTEARAIGCTQVTEIRYTQGVTLVGVLPLQFELATMYSAAVCATAADAARAKRLVALLSGDESAAIRVAGGFEP